MKKTNVIGILIIFFILSNQVRAKDVEEGSSDFIQNKTLQGVATNYDPNEFAETLIFQDTQSYNDNGTLNTTQGEYKEEAAINDDDTTIEIGSNQADLANSHLTKARSKSKIRKYYWGAYKDYSKAIELNPQLGEALAERGQVLNKLGKPEEAIIDLKRAAKIFKESHNTEKYEETQVFINKVIPHL